MPILDLIGIAGLLVAIAVFVQNIRLENRIKRSLQQYRDSAKGNNEMVEAFINFKTSFDFAIDAMLISDADGKVLYCNRRFAQITGYTQEEIMHSKAGTLWGKQMDTRFYERLWDTIKVDLKPFVGTLTNKKKSGQQYQAQVRIIPILDAEKQHAQYFISIEHEV